MFSRLLLSEFKEYFNPFSYERKDRLDVDMYKNILYWL